MEMVFVLDRSVESTLLAFGANTPVDPAVVEAATAQLVEKIQHQ